MDLTDPKIKFVIGTVVVLLVTNILINFFKPDRNLKDLKNILDSAQLRIDNSIRQVDFAKSKIHDIDTSLSNFRTQVVLSQHRADSMDAVRNNRNTEFLKRTDQNVKAIKEAKADLDLSNTELPDITTEILKPDQQ